MESKGESKDKEQLKERRKISLDKHNEQVLVAAAAPDASVRIYDRIPFYYWIIGAASVLGAIVECMFQLWPPCVRNGVHYLSVAAVGFLVLIIVLTILRLVVFCIMWALSMFWILFQYEYEGEGVKKPVKGKKKKKDKVSDDERDAEVEPQVTPAETKRKKKLLVDGKDSSGESDWGEKGDSQNEEAAGGKDSGESESGGSQRSSTGIRSTINHKFIFALAIGVSIGFSLAFILLISSEYSLRNGWFGKSDTYYHDDSRGLPHLNHDQDQVETAFQFGAHKHDEAFHMLEDTAVADAMARKVRVLCWVMTGPANHETKAMHVKKTWGTRCNILLFMSSVADERLPSIALPVKEGRDYLWGKTKAAFQYVYEHYRDEADWFMKADDDTYVVVENLRYMLSAHSPQDPVYFGCRFKPYVEQGYMSGGAGYVLSRAALHRFVKVALSSSKHCLQGDEGVEDLEIGKCLFNVGVKAGDSRDPLGRGRFFPYDPEQHLIPGLMDKNHWYWEYMYYKSEEGLDCCSDNAVSFHYVSPNMMYVLDYLIYRLKPYGIKYKVEISEDESNTGMVLKGVRSVAVSAKRGAEANLICCLSLTILILTVLVLLTPKVTRWSG